MVNYLDTAGLGTLVSNIKTQHYDHATDYNNPHNVTIEQLGIGKVENKNSEDIRKEITAENIVDALGFTPVSTVGGGQSDWNESDEMALSFIQNKPTAMPASDVHDWAKEAVKPAYSADEIAYGEESDVATQFGVVAAAIANETTRAEGVENNLDTKITTAKNDAKTYTDNAIAGLINGAPETLNTLKEIADAMAESESVVETLEAAVGSKISAVEIGNVTTGAAGSSAAVTATTANNVSTLSFTIPQGLKGDKGDKGETGATGSQGIQGPKGDTGAQGPQGITPTIKAANGSAVGSVGTPSVTASTSGTTTTFTFNYLKGAKGDKGDTGATGPKGDKGATGPKGDKGAQGIQGPQGPQGPAGNANIQSSTTDIGAGASLTTGKLYIVYE